RKTVTFVTGIDLCATRNARLCAGRVFDAAGRAGCFFQFFRHKLFGKDAEPVLRVAKVTSYARGRELVFVRNSVLNRRKIPPATVALRSAEHPPSRAPVPTSCRAEQRRHGCRQPSPDSRLSADCCRPSR